MTFLSTLPLDSGFVLHSSLIDTSITIVIETVLFFGVGEGLFATDSPITSTCAGACPRFTDTSPLCPNWTGVARLCCSGLTTTLPESDQARGVTRELIACSPDDLVGVALECVHVFSEIQIPKAYGAVLGSGA